MGLFGRGGGGYSSIVPKLFAAVEAAGLSGKVVLVHGVSRREIMDIAGKRRATLTCMGTQGRSGLRHLLFGSVVDKVVRHAACPVLMTRHPEPIAASQEGLS